MKKIVLIFGMLLIGWGGSAQDVPETQVRARGVTDELKSVLDRTLKNCQSIKGGCSVMEYATKFMSEDGTERYPVITCNFKKVPEDSLFEMYFTLSKVENDTLVHWLYTGNELVGYTDSKGVVYQRDRYENVMKNIIEEDHFFAPVTSQFCFPVNTQHIMADSAYTFSLKDTLLDGRPCYYIDFISTKPDTVSTLELVLTRCEVEQWIDKQDYMPVQYDIYYDISQGRDTMTQYECFSLKSFTPEWDEKLLTLESIPSGVSLSEYVEVEEDEPVTLSKGSRAPNWALPSLTGDTVRLSDLKGKVVLIDFFYRSCAPCCAALPALQRLHEKYKDRGFVMIGIDPYDDPQKVDMAEFLSKRGINYTVLFSDFHLPQDYGVYGYPTLFFVNRRGKIVSVQVGYGQATEEELEKQLRKML